MWAAGAAKAAGGALLTAGLAAAVLPAVINTPMGLRGVLAVVNHQAPGLVQVAEVHAGWLQPVKIKGLQVFDDADHGGEELLSVGQISTTATLLQIVTGSDFDVVVHEPTVNCGYDLAAKDFRVVRWLEGAGIMDTPATPPRLSTSIEPISTGDAGDSPASAGGSGSTPPAAEAALPPPQRPAAERRRGVKAAAAAGAEVGAGETEGGSRLLRMLTKADATMGWSADFSMARVQVHVADGVLRVPAEVRDMVGPHLHITSAMGRAALAGLAGELAIDATWVEQAPLAGLAEELAGRREEPFMLHVDAEHVHAEVRGWRDASSRDGRSRLHRPATATLDFTPGLARFFMASVNPLLSNVVSVAGDGKLSFAFAPDRLRLPYTTATVSAAPMRLRLGGGPAMSQVLRLLYPTGSAQLGDADISAWDVTFTRGGQAVADRVDMRLGVGKRAVPLALWGAVDLETDAIDMQVGLPAATLALLGVRDVPPDYVLPVPLRGTTDRPALDLGDASGKLAQLLLRQQLLDLQRPRATAATAAPSASGEEGRSASAGAGLGAAGAEEDRGVDGGRGGKGGGGLRSLFGAVVRAVAPQEATIKRVDAMIAAHLRSVPPPSQGPLWGQDVAPPL